MVNINVKKVLEKLLSTRMVIESGTDGIWTYRKWSDGTAECWGVFSNTTSHYATVFGGYGYNSGTVNFPQNLFQSAPIPTFSARIGNGFAVTGTQTNSLTNTSSNFYAVSSASGSQTCYWYIYLVGKWATLDPSSSTLNITGFSQRQMTKAEIRALIEGSGNIYKDNDTWIPSNLT